METMERQRVTPEELAPCEGYGVYRPRARIGGRRGDPPRPPDGRPKLLLVRAGLLGSWLVHVPVDQVQAVDRGERRIDLRSGGLLAGPRRV
jgi:hypothetical protein